jgi:outer membrane immunogenic protein
MKKIFLASIAFAALVAGPALAADMRAPAYKAPPAPPAPIYTWTGCYIGGNVGWARSETKVRVNGVEDGSLSSDGFAGGGQIGCDYQFASNWVVGIRGLVDATDFNHHHLSTIVPFVGDTFHDRGRWFATVTGRLGFLVAPSFLIYGIGGWGWVDNRFDVVTPAGTVLTTSSSNSRNGADAGVGGEWMFAPGWSLWAEWDHIFLKNRDFLITTAGPVVNTVNVRRDFDKVLVGINWRFGGVGGPVRAAY